MQRGHKETFGNDSFFTFLMGVCTQHSKLHKHKLYLVCCMSTLTQERERDASFMPQLRQMCLRNHMCVSAYVCLRINNVIRHPKRLLRTGCNNKCII